MTIIFIILGILLLPIFTGTISILFNSFNLKWHMLRQAKKSIREANQWKSDIEYYLEILKTEKSITFQFEGSNVSYNYEKMNYLLNRTITYLKNYDIYVKYIKTGQGRNLLPPHFHQEYNHKAEGVEPWISNYVEVIEEEKEIEYIVKFV